MKKGPPFNVPMHAHAKGNARDEWRRKRKKMPFSSSLLSSSFDHSHSPPSSPSSSKDEESSSSPKWTKVRRRRKAYATRGQFCRYHQFKKGGKIITFFTYNGTFGATNKILAFIQQYDATFRDEYLSKCSNLCNNVAMHFKSLDRQWWLSLHAQGRAPKIWKVLCMGLNRRNGSKPKWW